MWWYRGNFSYVIEIVCVFVCPCTCPPTQLFVVLVSSVADIDTREPPPEAENVLSQGFTEDHYSDCFVFSLLGKDLLTEKYIAQFGRNYCMQPNTNDFPLNLVGFGSNSK